MLIAPNSKPTPRRARPVERPAPIMGLNTRLSIRDRGDKGYAERLENWICRPDGLHIRNGWATHTKLMGPVASLLTYKTSVIGRTDDRMGAVIKNEGGVHLVASANFDGPVIRFDGRQWRDAEITGVDPYKLRGACRHGERLFFFEADTFRLWYFGLDAIQGPAQLFPLDFLFTLGGSIAAIGSTTADGGVGGDDQFVIVTTMGEVAVYTGNNPQDPAKWGLVGTFTTGKPVGPRCIMHMGGSLGLITETGAVSVPAALSAAAAERDAAMFTQAIDIPGAVSGFSSDAADLTVIHAGAVQYVQDPETKGWSHLTGLDATCWAETPDGLYFGRIDGTVAKYQGWSDNPTHGPCTGAAIPTLMVEGFARYGSSGEKTFTNMRPIWTTARPYKARMELLFDYQDIPARFAAANESSPDWDWSHFASIQTPVEWSKPISTRLGAWRGIGGKGSTAALVVGAKFHGHEAVWHGHEVEIIPSGGLRR